ncbi:RidA family protein [Clostridium cylindrosporum]|uniref:RutC family protein n=1 Tax=Clostridium cylindrosporum DSM 605 TaxID=1121307 RepID=A0A0J8DB81_CLOCY|nr:RidA family protein [Clostridium cylindrosporum]KMT21559.1 RutC family protein [Clostridium cylindrosporum DSM 605]
MSKEIINTSNAPAAIGPYSQAIKVGNMLFTSGQIPLDPATGDLINSNIEEATRRVLDNLKAVLEAGGSSLENVIKTTVFLKNMDDFVAVNEIYAEYFTVKMPARSAVQVAKLPKDSFVEIEAIALAE